MKRTILFFLVLIISLTSIFTLLACDKEGEGEGEEVITAATYSVTFMKEGSEYAKTDVKSGSTVYMPSNPLKEGYTFSGWLLNGAPFSFTSAITADTVLEASFTRRVLTITFKIEGQEDIVKTINYGEALTDIPTVPQKPNFISEWTQTDFSNLTSDLVILAKYTPIYTVKVKFLSTPPAYMGITPYEVTLDCTSGVGIESVPEPLAIDNHDAVWDRTDFTSLTEDITVNAIYTPKDITITFSGFDADSTETDKTISIPITLPCGAVLKADQIPVLSDMADPDVYNEERNTNFRWSGPNTGDFDTTKPCLRSETLVVTYDTKVNVSFILGEGGTFEGTTTLKSGDNVLFANKLLEEPEVSKLGYKLTGWSFSVEGEFPYLIPDTTDTITITANWEQIFLKVYLPDVDGIGYSDVTEGISFPYGSDYSFRINTEKTVESVLYNGITIVPVGGLYTINELTEDVSVGIKTSDLDVFNISFSRDNGASIFTVRSVTEGTILQSIPEFSGLEYIRTQNWAYGELLNILDSPITQSVTLTEHFTFSRYEVLYSSTETEFFQETVTYGDEDLIIPTPSAVEGSVFAGWYLSTDSFGEAPISKEKIISLGQNTSLYAKWISEYSVTDEAILGFWKSENSILSFQNNGKLKIRGIDDYREMSFTAENGVYKVLGNNISLASEVLTFEGVAYSKVNKAVLVKYGDIVTRVETTGFTLSDNVKDLYWSFTSYPTANGLFLLSEKTLDLEQDNLFLELYLIPLSNRIIAITYDAAEGVVPFTKQELSLSLGGRLYTATREGYTFVGWFDESGNKVDEDYLDDESTLFNISLTARWLSNETDYSSLPIIGYYTKTVGGLLYCVEFSPDATYTITTINTAEGMFSAQGLHYSFSNNAYLDNNSETITLDENGITMKLSGENVTFAKPNLGSHDNKHLYTGTNPYVFYLFRDGSLIINDTSIPVCSDGTYYYYIYDGDLSTVKIADLNSSEGVPQDFIGTWHFIDDNETIFLTIDSEGYISIDDEVSLPCYINGKGYLSANEYLELSETSLRLVMTNGEITFTK